MGAEREARAPTGLSLGFMRKLDPTGLVPKNVPGGKCQAENTARMQCRRRGWVLFRGPGQGFGWILTESGIAALAKAPQPTGGGATEGE